MVTPTITKLRELRDGIREEVRQIKIADYSATIYGPEKEYTIKGVIAGINALMVDVSALCKSSSVLIRLSTATERNNLVINLTDMLSYLQSRDVENVVSIIDKLKVMLRNYNLRSSSDREEEFITYIDDLTKKSLHLSQEIQSITEANGMLQTAHKSAEETIESLNNKVSEVTSLIKDLSAKIDDSEKTRLTLDEMLEEDESKSKEIESLLNESKSHKELIDSFSKRVSSREDQLDKQQASTEEYYGVLDKFKIKQETLLSETIKLIESAKLALQYKTAEGLSAAFGVKHQEAAEDKSTNEWITRATLFLVAAILVGLWLFVDKSIRIEVIVGRLSLIPILIAGAWFCAGQYVKQKNIAEDYAYKSVLAKSIIGFSDQLSDESRKGEDYSHYVKSVLSEIHKDPLRNRSEKNKSEAQSPELKDLLKELVALRKLPDKLDKILGVSEK